MKRYSEKSDAETLPLRRGLTALRMTNSSLDFNDDDSLDHWRNIRDAFGERAVVSYNLIQKAVGEKGPA